MPIKNIFPFLFFIFYFLFLSFSYLETVGRRPTFLNGDVSKRIIENSQWKADLQLKFIVEGAHSDSVVCMQINYCTMSCTGY